MHEPYIPDITERYPEGFREYEYSDSYYDAWEAIREEYEQAKAMYEAQAPYRKAWRDKVKRIVAVVLAKKPKLNGTLLREPFFDREVAVVHADGKYYLCESYKVTFMDRHRETRWKHLEITQCKDMLEKAYQFLDIIEREW